MHQSLRASFSLLCVGVGLGLVGCANDDPDPPKTERGAVLRVDELGHFDADELQALLEDFDLDASRVDFGVDAYRFIYATLDPSGAPTTASSLLAVPRQKAKRLPAAVWMHGTTVFRGEAASVNPDSSDRATALFFAAAGYPTIAPDYLGLGEGPGPHPYDDAPTEVSASIDALLAARQLLGERGLELEPEVLVSGHSQGARASLELGLALQGGAAPGLTIGALAPVSGPYDMSHTLSIAVSEGIAYTTAYVSYLVIAWNRLHHLYDAPSEAFLPPYDETIEALFDNDHPPEEVVGSLPETLEALFTPAFLAELRNPSGPLRDALSRADRACRYDSAVDVHLFAASGDLDVPISNAEHCRDELEERGVDVDLVDLGNVDHSTSANLALPLVLEVFARR